MMKYLIALVLSVVSLTTFAKDNFKMTGVIDGAGNDTLCIEYVILQPKKEIVTHQVAVKNGEFSFSTKLREAYSATMYLKKIDDGNDTQKSCQHNSVDRPSESIPIDRTDTQFQHQSRKDKASSNEEAFFHSIGFSPHHFSMSLTSSRVCLCSAELKKVWLCSR